VTLSGGGLIEAGAFAYRAVPRRRIAHPPRLAVLVPCSKRKVTCPAAPASASEISTAGVPERLQHSTLQARELYRGRQFLAMAGAVDDLKRARPDIATSLHIVSAGYGLLAADDIVVPYEATLGSRRREWVSKGHQLGLPDLVRELLDSVDAAIVALSEAYLVSCALPHHWATQTQILYLSPPSTALQDGSSVVWSGRSQARALGVSERDIRGRLLRAVLRRVATNAIPALETLDPDPVAWPELAR
jgi:hypothetical protein